MCFVVLHLFILLLLGAVSIDVFDPVVPMAVLIAANEPPTELITRAMPLTTFFTLGAAGATSLLWGRSLAKFGSSLRSSTVLIVFLGLNVSALGFVEMSSDSPAAVGEFLGLIAVIMLSYGLAFFAIERRALFLPRQDEG